MSTLVFKACLVLSGVSAFCIWIAGFPAISVAVQFGLSVVIFCADAICDAIKEAKKP